jgi:hypothetical protein
VVADKGSNSTDLLFCSCCLRAVMNRYLPWLRKQYLSPELLRLSGVICDDVGILSKLSLVVSVVLPLQSSCPQTDIQKIKMRTYETGERSLNYL